jgi:hypothetical protein
MNMAIWRTLVRVFWRLTGIGHFQVRYTETPPVRETLPPEWLHAAEHARPDPEAIGRTVAAAIGHRGEAVALIVGGLGVRESRYVVSVNTGPVKTPDGSPR